MVNPHTGTPSAGTLGTQATDREHKEAEGVALDATGVTSLGALVARSARVVRVVVDAAVADAEFQVNLNGSAVFTSPRAHGGTGVEVFIPNADGKEDAGVELADLEFEVTTASATTGATGDVYVAVETPEVTVE